MLYSFINYLSDFVVDKYYLYNSYVGIFCAFCNEKNYFHSSKCTINDKYFCSVNCLINYESDKNIEKS